MPDAPRNRPLMAFSVVAAASFVLGVGIAAVGGSREPVFVTDTLSYVPAEAWWAHGLLFSLTVVLLAAAVWGARWLAGMLFRHGLLFLAVGLLLGGMGLAMIALALTVDTLDDGQRVMFGWVMGPLLALFGAWMAATGFRNRRSPTPPSRRTR